MVIYYMSNPIFVIENTMSILVKHLNIKIINLINYLLIFSLLLSAFSWSAVIGPDRNQRKTYKDTMEFIRLETARWEDRYQYLNFDQLLDILKIKPGMVIVDVGAGTGYFSTRFATKMHGKGKIYETEIRKSLVNFLREDAENKGFGDIIEPVQVTTNGVDAFYGKQKYDLIFLSNVYYSLLDRTAFIAKMKKYLKRNGKVALVNRNMSPQFCREDIVDAKNLVAYLVSKKNVEPIYNRLSPATKTLMEQSGAAPSEHLINELVKDFNNILDNKYFYKDFITWNGYFYNEKGKITKIFPHAERNYINWLLMNLIDDRTLEKDFNKMTDKEQWAVRKLNRCFFVVKLKEFLYRDGWGYYMSLQEINRHSSYIRTKHELEDAGYRFESVQSLGPLHEVSIFRVK